MHRACEFKEQCERSYLSVINKEDGDIENVCEENDSDFEGDNSRNICDSPTDLTKHNQEIYETLKTEYDNQNDNENDGSVIYSTKIISTDKEKSPGKGE